MVRRVLTAREQQKVAQWYKDHNKLVHNYVKQNFKGVSKDERYDYEQECWTYITRHVDKYDEKRGAITTFLQLHCRTAISAALKAQEADKRKANYSIDRSKTIDENHIVTDIGGDKKRGDY